MKFVTTNNNKEIVLNKNSTILNNTNIHGNINIDSNININDININNQFGDLIFWK